MPPAEPLIQLSGITKVFLAEEIETHALAGVHLTIQSGEFLSISGPSGCGKSTLLSIIGLLEPPTSGRYYLDDQNVADLPSPARARIRNREIGFIFQSFNLIGDLNVFENVELPLTYRGLPRDQRHQMATEALQRVDLFHRSRHLPGQLSGGQQQRVAVARALAGQPRLLLADEPTGNLDSRNGSAVMDLLTDLNQNGTTICMVTHDDRYAHYANRIVHLFDGRVMDESTPTSQTRSA